MDEHTYDAGAEPLTATVLGELGSLVATVRVADLAPADVGWNLNGTWMLAPGATLIGNVRTCGTWKSVDDEERAVMSSGQVPRLSMVTARSRNAFGIGQNSPKLPVSAIIATAVAWPTLAVVVTFRAGKFGSLLLIVRSVERVPDAVGVNATSKGKQKSWLMVTGNPADGATTANSGFDDVIELMTRSPALVLHTFSAASCLSPRQAGV